MHPDIFRGQALWTDSTFKGYYNFNCLFSTSPLAYRKNFKDEYYASRYFPWTGTMG